MVLPCTVVDSPVSLGITAFINLFACDKYAAVHVIAPLIVAVMTRNFYFAFTLAGINEVFELLLYVIRGNYVGFIGANDKTENLTGVLLEDWLIQGGIGTIILGALFLYVIPGKPMIVWSDLWKRPKRFFFYVIIMFLMLLPVSLYAIQLGNFNMGILAYPFIQLIFIGIIFLKEGRKEFQTELWITLWLFSLVINVSNMFDYLYSGSIQSWFISVLFLYYLILRKVIKTFNVY